MIRPEILETMDNVRKVQIPVYSRAANDVNVVDSEQRTVEVVWGSETPVLRYDWKNETYFNEVLSFDPAHVRMDRMSGGVAPVLDNHNSLRGTNGVLGKVESSELRGDHGTAVLRFADTDDVANTWRKVETGIIKGVSVGYRVLNYEDTGEKGENGFPNYRATDWEPMEVSIAPIPADPRSKAREEDMQTVSVRSAVVEPAKVEPTKEVTQPTRDAKAQNHTYMKVNLNDLKASRKALQTEFLELDALTERDETQEARYSEVIGKIAEVDANIEREEKAEAIRAAKFTAGPSSTAEEGEKKKMMKAFDFRKVALQKLNGQAIDGVAHEMKRHAEMNGHLGSGDIVIPGDFVRAGGADDFQAGSGDGSGFVATEVGGFVEGLTAPIQVEEWGTQVITGATSNFQLPKESVKATATAEGETDAGAASGMEMDQTDFGPKRYHSDTSISKQLLLQATGNVNQIVAAALQRGHERKLMTDIFSGGGSPAITGILGISGVNDIAATATGDHSAIALDLEAAVLEDHGLTPNARYILSPSAYRYFAEAAKVTGVNGVIDMNNKICGYDYVKTPYLADASAGVGQAIFGDFANAYLVYFGGIDLVIDPYSGKDTAQIQIAMNRWVDFNIPQAMSFAFENGITAT